LFFNSDQSSKYLNNRIFEYVIEYVNCFLFFRETELFFVKRNYFSFQFRFFEYSFLSFRISFSQIFFVSFRFVSFRFVSFRFVSFRFVSFRFVSFRFVYCCVVYWRGLATLIQWKNVNSLFVVLNNERLRIAAGKQGSQMRSCNPEFPAQRERWRQFSCRQ
jgi:hypothetical protein